MHSLYTAIAVCHMVVAFLIMVGYLIGVARPARQVPPLMLWAARVQLLLGIVIVGIGSGALHSDYNYAKITVKLLVALAVVACLEMARARARRSVATDCFPTGARVEHTTLPMLVHAAFILTLVNTCVAFFWH